MFILCETSSLLMLLRIAPDMFTSDAYECKTIREVHNEIVQTTKFKSKYPWTRVMRAKIKPLFLSIAQKKKEAVYFDTIRALNRIGTINLNTYKYFDLSYQGMKVESYALTLNYRISSGDKDLVAYI